MIEKMVDSNGACLAVRDDEREGEAVIMLHGGPGVPDSMQTTVAPLLDGLRCISFDQRGVGRSQCRDGCYTLDAYLADIEAVRAHAAVARWHVFGHSWGGLLAQVYTARHPERVASLVLSSSSLGVGHDWRRTKREAFKTDRARAGRLGMARLLAFGAGLYVPGATRRWAMRHVMTETWRNYFLDPRAAPAPDPAWLAGCSAEAMLRTDRTVTRAPSQVLDRLADYRGPTLVLYGGYDIFGSATEIVRDRFPHARHVTLPNSGHLHWLQDPGSYRTHLHNFYATALHSTEQ